MPVGDKNKGAAAGTAAGKYNTVRMVGGMKKATKLISVWDKTDPGARSILHGLNVDDRKDMENVNARKLRACFERTPDDNNVPFQRPFGRQKSLPPQAEPVAAAVTVAVVASMQNQAVAPAARAVVQETANDVVKQEVAKEVVKDEIAKEIVKEEVANFVTEEVVKEEAKVVAEEVVRVEVTKTAVKQEIVKEDVKQEVAKEVVKEEVKKAVKDEVAKEVVKEAVTDAVTQAVKEEHPVAAKAVEVAQQEAAAAIVTEAVTQARASMAGRKALIVYAHEEHKSFNHALLEVAEKSLRDQGYQVAISNLYEMNFNPVAGKRDIKGDLLNANHIKYNAEVAQAYIDGRLSDDIEIEQDKLEDVDLVIFQFPMQWFGFPAILKGWFDRVMCYKFAYGDKQFCDQGRFQGKKAILSFTTRDSETSFSNKGVNGDMDIYLWPMQYGVLRYCGFEVLPPNIVYAPGAMSATQRIQVLEKWYDRLKVASTEKPLFFIPVEYFDPNSGFQLNEKAIAENAKVRSDFGPTIGQNLGKPLRPSSMLFENLE